MIGATTYDGLLPYLDDRTAAGTCVSTAECIDRLSVCRNRFDSAMLVNSIPRRIAYTRPQPRERETSVVYIYMYI
jgi:hypothetical protein